MARRSKQVPPTRALSARTVTYVDALRQARRLEKRISLRSGYLACIRDGDDWSFIIKLHALAEASLSMLLRDWFDDSRLNVWLSRFRMQQKVQLAATLELIDGRFAEFLNKLSEVRNVFAHDPRFVGMSLVEYLRGLAADKRASAIKGLGYVEAPENVHRFDRAPADSIWHGAVLLLSTLSLVHGDLLRRRSRHRSTSLTARSSARSSK